MAIPVTKERHVYKN